MNFGTHRGIELKGSKGYYETKDGRSFNTFHINAHVNNADIVAHANNANHVEARNTAIRVIDAILDGDEETFDKLRTYTGLHSHTGEVYIGFKQR